MGSINVDLARRPLNSDAFIQRMAIYAFIAVASIILLMVAFNFIKRTVGPLDQLLKQPAVAEPVVTPKKTVAPAGTSAGAGCRSRNRSGSGAEPSRAAS